MLAARPGDGAAASSGWGGAGAAPSASSDCPGPGGTAHRSQFPYLESKHSSVRHEVQIKAAPLLAFPKALVCQPTTGHCSADYPIWTGPSILPLSRLLIQSVPDRKSSSGPRRGVASGRPSLIQSQESERPWQQRIPCTEDCWWSRENSQNPQTLRPPNTK